MRRASVQRLDTRDLIGKWSEDLGSSRLKRAPCIIRLEIVVLHNENELAIKRPLYRHAVLSRSLPVMEGCTSVCRMLDPC